MAQQARAPAAKPDGPEFDPGTHMVEGEYPRKLSSDHYMYVCHTHPTHLPRNNPQNGRKSYPAGVKIQN